MKDFFKKSILEGYVNNNEWNKLFVVTSNDNLKKCYQPVPVIKNYLIFNQEHLRHFYC